MSVTKQQKQTTSRGHREEVASPEDASPAASEQERKVKEFCSPQRPDRPRGHNHRSGVRRPHGSRCRPAPRNLQRPWRAAPSRLGVPCGLVSTSVHFKRRSRLRAVGRPTAGARVPATGVRAASPGPECGSDFPVCGVGPRGRAVSLLCERGAEGPPALASVSPRAPRRPPGPGPEPGAADALFAVTGPFPSPHSSPLETPLRAREKRVDQSHETKGARSVPCAARGSRSHVGVDGECRGRASAPSFTWATSPSFPSIPPKPGGSLGPCVPAGGPLPSARARCCRSATP